MNIKIISIFKNTLITNTILVAIDYINLLAAKPSI